MIQDDENRVNGAYCNIRKNEIKQQQKIKSNKDGFSFKRLKIGLKSLGGLECVGLPYSFEAGLVNR